MKFGPQPCSCLPCVLLSSLDASAQCFSYGLNVWCGVKGSRSLWMNILEGDSVRRRDTKWLLCPPLQSSQSCCRKAPTLVSHKSKAAWLCWGGRRSTGQALCARSGEAWRRKLTDGVGDEKQRRRLKVGELSGPFLKRSRSVKPRGRLVDAGPESGSCCRCLRLKTQVAKMTQKEIKWNLFWYHFFEISKKQQQYFHTGPEVFGRCSAPLEWIWNKTRCDLIYETSQDVSQKYGVYC